MDVQFIRLMSQGMREMARYWRPEHPVSRAERTPRVLRTGEATDMEDNRTMRIETLKARVVGADYHVDTHAVAEALLGHPATHVWLLPHRGTAARTAATQPSPSK
jgi:hypothetical protein